MSAGSNGRTSVPSASHMRLQLDDMLDQQAAAAALDVEVRSHQHTQTLLQDEHRKLQIASAEVTNTTCIQALQGV